MSQAHHSPYGKINFIKLAIPFGIFSLVATVASFIIIGVKGFNYGIDFSGGTEVQIKFAQPVEPGRLREALTKLDFHNISVQSFSQNLEHMLRMEQVRGKTDKESNEILRVQIQKLTEGLKANLSAEQPSIERVDSVGPQVGDELKRNSLLAAFYCVLIILIYVGLRFDYKYAPPAVLCLVHDTVFTLGIFSLINEEINVHTTAALLTLIGYSLNDTIINYDRIRENVTKYRDWSFSQIVNRSVNDVFTRSLLTSMTVFVIAVVLYIFANGAIRDFGLTMSIGVFVGTYSSIYVASPLVIVLDKWYRKRAV